jgi:DNA polymerase I-like protein with 3'-5' exonuclease and polymerase domains
MAGRYVFDCETDGFLDVLTKVHCIGIYNLDTGLYTRFVGRQVEEAVHLLDDADLLVGHNIIKFDIPALRKVFPWFKPRGLVLDTLVLTSLLWPHVGDLDAKRVKAKQMPGKLAGAQTLEAWGYRLGNYKGDYKGPWDTYNETMGEYMDQDVNVTRTLWNRCLKELTNWCIDPFDPDPPPGKDCVALEHSVAEIAGMIERHGWRVDKAKMVALVAKLTARKQQLNTELQAAFPPIERTHTFTPKASNRKFGYVKGVEFTKRRLVAFNPASRQMVAERLQGLGWKPESFGKDGTPTVDGDILTALPYPQAKVLAEFYTVDKRLGQIANGRQAWLKHVDASGRIRHRIKTNGAHTGRMAHASPNVAQVPGNHAPYGEECRDAWLADAGCVLVGCDADALELRDLAGYMARYDGGAYIETVLRGDKSQGTDMHTINANLIGCTRDVAKVFFYALIYGAADTELGRILGGGRAMGRRARERLLRGLPALGALVEAVQGKAAKQGFLRGLDGRRLVCRGQHAALNTLLQSAGAVQMKRGLAILYRVLTADGWEFGREWALHGLIHDEWQASVIPALADTYGDRAVAAIRGAGQFYSFRCPLDAQYQKGETWKDTH